MYGFSVGPTSPLRESASTVCNALNRKCGCSRARIASILAVAASASPRLARSLDWWSRSLVYTEYDIVVPREVTGPYSQHPVLFKQLLQYTTAKYGKPEALWGIYPDDPDAVKPEDLHWTVAVRISPKDADLAQTKEESQREDVQKRSLASLQPAADPYKLVLLGESLAAVVDSTMAAAPKDGLAIIPWMASNGFVQIAPTRMEYLTSSGDPAL